jgi:hypothetical protein
MATIGILLASIAAGGTDTGNAVSDDGPPDYESGRAYELFGASGTAEAPSQTLVLVVSAESGTVDDDATAAAVADIVT